QLLVCPTIPAQRLDVAAVDGSRLGSQLEHEVEKGHLRFGERSVAVVARKAIELVRRNAELVEEVAMRGDAVHVAMTSGQREKNGFLLNARESARRQEDGSRDLCLGLDHSREQALRAKDGRHKAEVVAERLVGRERVGQRRLRQEAHLLCALRLSLQAYRAGPARKRSPREFFVNLCCDGRRSSPPSDALRSLH